VDSNRFISNCFEFDISSHIDNQCYTHIVIDGRKFETRCGYRFFFNLPNVSSPLGPGIYSTSSRNEHHKQKDNVSGK
jgi:hypothetical protein